MVIFCHCLFQFTETQSGVNYVRWPKRSVTIFTWFRMKLALLPSDELSIHRKLLDFCFLTEAVFVAFKFEDGPTIRHLLQCCQSTVLTNVGY